MYNKTTWLARLGTGLNKWRDQITNQLLEFINEPDTVTQAGTPFSVTAMNNIEDGIESLSNKLSEDIAITSAITVIPVTVITGQTKPTFKGLTVVNDFEKGDLDASITSDASGSTFDWRDDTEAWIFSSAFSVLTKQFSVELDKKYFIYCKLKNNSVGRIRTIFIRYPDESFQQASPTVEDNLRMSGTIIADKTDACNFKVVESTAGLIERDYQLWIPVTDLGLDDLTDEQLTDLCDAGFFSGFKNYNEVITSIGKNILDINNVHEVLNNAESVIENNSIKIEIGGSSESVDYIAKVIPGQSYRLSATVTDIVDFGRIRVANLDGSFITQVRDAFESVTFIPTEGYIKLQFTVYIDPLTTCETLFENIQLEIGGVQTVHEAYKKSTQRISGSSLPNIVDTESIKNISDLEEIASGIIINTTNFPEAKLNGDFILIQNDGIYVIDIVDGNTTTTDDGFVSYQLEQPQPRTDSEVLTVFTDGSINIPYVPYELTLEESPNNEAQVRFGNAKAIGRITNRLPSVRNNYIMKAEKWVNDTATSGYWIYDIPMDCTSDDIPTVNPNIESINKVGTLTNTAETINGFIRVYAFGQPSENITVTAGVR